MTEDAGIRRTLDALAARLKSDLDRAIADAAAELSGTAAARRDDRQRLSGSTDTASRASTLIRPLLEGVTALDLATSLSEVLDTLADASQAIAPRSAVLLVNGDHATLWRSSTRVPMSPLRPFAGPFTRSVSAPLVVEGVRVGLLYGDDGADEADGMGGEWPGAIELLAAHASRCLATITATKTAALRPAASPRDVGDDPALQRGT
jgi:hypothetical protein